ncbi:MAG: tRNA (adenosine(37)-N6)-dimethylallyltransferase MiaA [Rubrivivax sp.]
MATVAESDTRSDSGRGIAHSALCLTGPTASGKSAVALALAQHLPIEIISVDSALVYRGMDIGTAKPTAAERAAVPHHLIDILEPTETYSAARFVADAERLVTEINARGRLALLTGGTMLYFNALQGGLDPMPAADPVLRATIEAEAAAQGWPALHAQLARVDPATALRLPPADAQRIQRALEVWRASGIPLSHWQRQVQDPSAAALKAPLADLPMVSLEPSDRAWLHQRIAQRFDAMLAQGLIAEVQALQARSDLHAALPSMRCVGYRQTWAALDQGNTAGVREQGIVATRQLAKRQLTWLRAMPSRQVLACDLAGAQERAVALLLQLARR